MIPIGDDNRSYTFPILTITLIAANFFVFFKELTLLDPESLITTYALIPRLITFADYNTWLPFVSYMFLHGGFMHIISNMLFLWIFGDNVEDIYGKVRFIVIYFLSGFAAALVQYLFNPLSPVPILGASGAVASVLAAYLVRFPTARVRTIVPLFPLFIPLHVPAFLLIGIWFFTQVFNGLSIIGIDTLQGGVAWWAHIGGFLTGMSLAYILPHDRTKVILQEADY